MHDSSIRRTIRLAQMPASAAGAISDAELLTRFTLESDDAAFELLLRRHGPMVLAACRRILDDPHDAEDAFQAAFLALVRRGKSIARRDAVAAWLFRVAFRAAMRLRSQQARRMEIPTADMEPLAKTSDPFAGNFELWQVLDEEVERLPTRHRSAFVLCCLEGMTIAEAARELKCPPGTVSSRLTRARMHLRIRLTRRGLAPAAIAGLAVIPVAATAAPLIHSTLEAAHAFGLGRAVAGAASSRPMILAEGVLRAMSRTKLKMMVVTLALIAVGAAGLLSRVIEASPPPADKPPKAAANEPAGPPAVTVVNPQKGGLAIQTNQPCSAESFQQVNIVATTSGFIKSMNVDIGSKVRKGDLLAVIDAPAIALDERLAGIALQQANGQVQAAKAMIQAATAECESAKSVVALRQAEAEGANAALTYTQKEFERIKSLLRNGTVDARVADEVQHKVLTAKAAVDAAAAAIANAKADLEIKRVKILQNELAHETARANSEAAGIALEKARLATASTRLLAPMDGVVTVRNYLTGDYVSAGSWARPVVTVQQMDKLRLIVQIPEQQAVQIHPGTPVDVTFPAVPQQHFNAKVSRIAYAEDPTTRTMRTEIDLPNADMHLRPGMWGQASIQLQDGNSAALRIPQASLVRMPEEKGRLVFGVYVVRDGRAILTRVRLGRSTREEAEVLSGLKPEDRVVADPKGLTGEKVEVEVRDHASDK
jgi:RND family efflux transporter MFP subunit